MESTAGNSFKPTELQTSKMRFYSYGIVAENKPLNTDIIDVTPTEEFTMLDGELTGKASTYKGKATDAEGQSYESTVKTSVAIKAKWLRLGDANRMTSPDVRRNEHVMLVQFGDAPQIWWMTIKQDSALRKLETVVWAFSGTKNEGAEMDPDNCYYFEMSTHAGLVGFHTSKANGEPFGYDIQIVTKEGRIMATDDVGNCFMIDSANSRVYMKNVNGSEIDIDKDNITYKAPATIRAVCKDYIVDADTATVNATTTITKDTTVQGATALQGGGSASGGSGGSSFQVSGGLSIDTARIAGTLDVAGYATFSGGHTPD